MEVTIPHDSDAEIGFPEKAFRSTIGTVLSALTQSGTTAQRPTEFLWIGRPYFDTDLGRVVRVIQLSPVVWATDVGGVRTFNNGTPASVPANSTAAHDVDVTPANLGIGDFVHVINRDFQTGLGIAGVAVVDSNTIRITYSNSSTGAIVPTPSQTYILVHIPA